MDSTLAAEVALKFWRGEVLSDEEDARLIRLDLESVSAWPIYARALDLSRTPAEQLAVAWQQIFYYVLYAQTDFADELPDLRKAIADSAKSSTRIGQFVADRVVLEAVAQNPGVGVLTAEVLNARFGWRWSDHVEFIYATVKPDPDRPLGLHPSSEFSSPSLRRLILRPFLPDLPRVGDEDPDAWAAWVSAVKTGEPVRDPSRALESRLRTFIMSPSRSTVSALDSAIVGFLGQGAHQLVPERDVRWLLADVLTALPGSSESVWLGVARELLIDDAQPAGAHGQESAWSRLHSLR